MCYSNENTWGSELEEEVQILMSVASMVEQNSNNLLWPAHQVYLVCVISHLSHVYVMSEAFKIWHCEIKFELSAFHFVQQNSKQLKLKYQRFISHFEMQERGCRLCEDCVCWKMIWNQKNCGTNDFFFTFLTGDLLIKTSEKRGKMSVTFRGPVFIQSLEISKAKWRPHMGSVISIVAS